MTLGTAASSSIRNVRTFDSRGVASSARKIEAITPKGTAINRARKAVTQVPYMKGKAPNFSAFGSHRELVRKLQPNVLTVDCELTHNSKTIKPTIVRISAAEASVTRRASSSQALIRR